MANPIAHQRNILEIQKPEDVLFIPRTIPFCKIKLILSREPVPLRDHK
jgi:hypothetical protein